MKYLAIETASETCSVALAADGEVLEYYRRAPRQHAELLLPWVSRILAEAGIGLAALDAIAFSRGPGSFTSLRIGIGVVQGLAWAVDRPVVPVSSLAAVAQTAALAGARTALVAMDARMGEVFTGQFRTNDRGIMVAVGPERVCRPEQVGQPDDPEAVAVGAGFIRYPRLGLLAGRMAGLQADTWPRASSVLQLAGEWLRGNEPLPAEQAQPVYLRDKVALRAPP